MLGQEARWQEAVAELPAVQVVQAANGRKSWRLRLGIGYGQLAAGGVGNQRRQNTTAARRGSCAAAGIVARAARHIGITT